MSYKCFPTSTKKSCKPKSKSKIIILCIRQEQEQSSLIDNVIYFFLFFRWAVRVINTKKVIGKTKIVCFLCAMCLHINFILIKT